MFYGPIWRKTIHILFMHININIFIYLFIFVSCEFFFCFGGVVKSLDRNRKRKLDTSEKIQTS
jgi:hypothetical protein